MPRSSYPRSDTVPLVDLHPDPGSIRDDVLNGLTADPKTLPCKYLYDERGSHYFERITELEEYYPTRTEIGILRRYVDRMAGRLGPRCLVVEYGSGSGQKTRILLDHLRDPAGYVPVEISREHLMRAAQELAEDYPHLEVLPVCADFTQELELPVPETTAERTAVFFPGSTIGNFTRDESVVFLRQTARLCGAGGALLIGTDLKKDPQVLERAYDDEQGVTAEFNLNLLRRINRELDANFDLSRFRHRATYDADEGRVEMHLDCTESHRMQVAGVEITFARGESIHTESSHKYTVDEFAALADEAGWTLGQVWTDDHRRFAVHYYAAR